MSKLPARTLNTISEAIAISSPNGKISKRAKKKAIDRLSVALFGENGLSFPTCEQPEKKERLLRQAQELRNLASRGMNVKKYTKQAEKLELQASKL